MLQNMNTHQIEELSAHLNDRIHFIDPSHESGAYFRRGACDETLRHTVDWLKDNGLDVASTLAWLGARGAQWLGPDAVLCDHAIGIIAESLQLEVAELAAGGEQSWN